MDWKKRLTDIAAEIDAGQTAAYNRGWEDCRQFIADAARQPPKIPNSMVADHAEASAPGPDGGFSVIDHTERVIMALPGLRGNEVVGRVAELMPGKERKLLDRTVRTALMRLKARERIFAVDNKWYSATITDPSSILEGRSET